MSQKLLPLAKRWIRFNAIGVMGVGVQLFVVIALRTAFEINYFLASFFAISCAIIHNFFWHQRWTWKGKNLMRGRRASFQRFVRFSSSSGTISIVGTLGFTALLVHSIHLPYLVCNLLAIGACNIANFLFSHQFVFQAAEAA